MARWRMLDGGGRMLDAGWRGAARVAAAALAAVALVAGPLALAALAQTAKLDGVSGNTFKIGQLSGTRTTLTNSSGVLSLVGLTVTSGTVNLSGATLTMPASLSLTAVSCSGQITSTVTTGTTPLVIASTTKVTNLNVDATDGISLAVGGGVGGVIWEDSTTSHNSIAAGTSGNLLASGGSGAPTWTATPSVTSLTATQTTGSAPFTISSTTKVTNLNVDQTDGISLAVGGGVGGIVWEDTTTSHNSIGAGTSGNLLASGGSGAPTWTATPSVTSLTATQTTGTAPFTISSTTKVTNLNVDATDGISLAAAGAAGGVVYESSATQYETIGAGTAGQFLLSGGTGAPTWGGLTSASFFVGNASNIPTAVAMSGDATLANTGVVTISNGAITAAKLATALEDLVVTGAISAGAEAADTIRVSFQAKDTNGNALAEMRFLSVGMSDSATSLAASGQTIGLTTVTGSLFRSLNANKEILVATDATGLYEVDVNLSGDVTVYCHVAIGSKIYTATLDFN